MVDFVGITNPLVYEPTKRDTLLFDRIGVAGTERLQSTIHASDLEWLMDRGIIFAADFEFPPAGSRITSALSEQLQLTASDAVITALLECIADDPSRLDELTSLSRIVDLIRHFGGAEHFDVTTTAKSLQERVIVQVRDTLDLHGLASQVHHATLIRGLRLLSAAYSTSDTHAVPLVPNSFSTGTAVMGVQEESVVQIALSNFPAPAADTPWHNIVSFRADDVAARSLRDLRYWMTKVARGSATNIEIAQELEHLIDEYQRHMELHQLKINRTVLETVLITTAEVAENLVRMQLSKVIGALFAVRNRQIMLLEAERAAPGREVAYIVRAKREFGGA